MVLRVARWTLDVHDVVVMATFWSQALGYRIDMGDDGAAKLFPPEDAAPEVATLWLQPTSVEKRAKNRAHLDLRPTGGADGPLDVDAEVSRLIRLGARRADVGQTGEGAFVVLADPEGNEFCVLRSEPRR